MSAVACHLCQDQLLEPAPATYDGHEIDRACAEALEIINSAGLVWLAPHRPASEDGGHGA